MSPDADPTFERRLLATPTERGGVAVEIHYYDAEGRAVVRSHAVGIEAVELNAAGIEVFRVVGAKSLRQWESFFNDDGAVWR